MSLRLVLPALPAGDDAPTCLEEWLDLAEADADFLDTIFDYWDHHGGPLVAIDPGSPVGAFLAPVVAARGGNAQLPLHLLEFLFARFLVLTPELLDSGHPGYRFGAMAISPCCVAFLRCTRRVPAAPSVPSLRSSHDSVAHCFAFLALQAA